MRDKPQPERVVTVHVGDVVLEGNLTVPDGARGVVLFAHGSGSSRHSPRNRRVAEALQRGRLATLLLDLLTVAEERVDASTGHLRFDIELLAVRLVEAARWLRGQPDTSELAIGYFGASTGGGAALVAAALRPDLAGALLPQVQAPALLIVGGNDPIVLDLNQRAFDTLQAEKRLEVIPGATHLFEEPGALDAVARLARAWFEQHLTEGVGRRVSGVGSSPPSSL